MQLDASQIADVIDDIVGENLRHAIELAVVGEMAMQGDKIVYRGSDVRWQGLVHECSLNHRGGIMDAMCPNPAPITTTASVGAENLVT